MRLLYIISSRPELYSVRRLVESGRKLGAEVLVLDPLKVNLGTGQGGREIYYGGANLGPPEFFITRVGGPAPEYALALSTQFELMGARALNSSSAMELARHKWRSLVHLSAHDIPVPHTFFSSRAEGIPGKSFLSPVVIKLLQGSKGRGVILAKEGASALSVLHAMEEMHVNVMVQEFLEEGAGRDLRIMVLNGKVIGAMERVAPPGEFRSNIHLGGSAREVELSAEEVFLAEKATKVLGLDFAGVDLIRSLHGPRILEVNPCPGLEGIEKVCEQNIAEKVVNFLMDNIND